MESFDQHGTPASQGTTARAGTSTTIRSGDEENYSYGEIDEGGEDTNLNSPEGEKQQQQSPQQNPSHSQPTSARPNLYQKRSTPSAGVVGAIVQPLYSGPTPARLFKRTLSEQQFGNRPISEVPPTISSTAQQSKSLPLTSQRSIPESIHSIQQKRRSPSIIDLSVKVKEVSQSVKNAAEDELRYELIRFAARTTAHGIPMLRFDNVPFPAITICNLNPFKREEARHVPEISETLEAYHQAVTYSKHADLYLDETPAVRERRNIREVGLKNGVQYVMVNIGYCTLPNTNTSNTVPCICQKSVNYCLIRPERLKRMWEVRGDKIPTEDSPFRTDFLNQLKELGYENMTDEVAITTKTREKLVLAMASLHKEQRKSLSYGRSEFIKMCSFNGQQCNINHDFKLHADPAFGNCYMFNANKSNPLVSSRAGPSYGLRLLVHINTSDYLPTTQASGVHIVIHSQDEHPFPDAFGYSAPTNQLSSFGISLRKVNRLPIPHGICLMPGEPKPEGYIYSDHKYEPEDVYTTAFSSARLISEAFRSFQCSGRRECKTEFDADSAAMLEIYYEQMSHEVLTESESYMFVNFISDIGGQAGLWLGASILTLFELFVFAFRIFTIVCRRRLRRNTIDFDIEDDDLEQQQKRSTSKGIPSSFTTTPKHSQMRKSASSLTSLSIRASALDAKVQAAKSERNTSLGSLNLAYQSPKTRKVTAEPFSARSARKLCKQTSFAVTEDEEEEENENIEEGYYDKQLTPSSDERTLVENI
uniref:Amiloride-sensitive sodium channel n=1 Tax=Meloidogyne javanica TaxID=6303 RepID=A0A915LBA2_MELJA